MKDYLNKQLNELHKKIADGNATEHEQKQYEKMYILWALKD